MCDQQVGEADGDGRHDEDVQDVFAHEATGIGGGADGGIVGAGLGDLHLGHGVGGPAAADFGHVRIGRIVNTHDRDERAAARLPGLEEDGLAGLDGAEVEVVEITRD